MSLILRSNEENNRNISISAVIATATVPPELIAATATVSLMPLATHGSNRIIARATSSSDRRGVFQAGRSSSARSAA
jgi:hypothetical protein